MLRRTPLVCAAEFKQKSRWSAVWPNMRYGAMYLNYSASRQLPMKGVNWVTRDSNRLVNFTNRYSSVVADLDLTKNKEELNIPLDDIRWNDHRRIYWLCSFCGSAYRKNVSVRTKFHAGCNFCKGKAASEVRGDEHQNEKPLSTFHSLVEELVDTGKKDNITSLSCTSKFRAQWTCKGCGQGYEASIRSRTGKVEHGQATLHPQIQNWTAYCPACTWKANLTPVGLRALAQGQFLGLGATPKPAKGAPPIPRRRKLVI